MVIVLAMVGTAPAAAPLRPDPASLERATPELIERLRADPYDYFRFVNRSWIARVCDDFARAEVMARGERLQDWWIRSLDPSYRQVRLQDLRSVGDLAAISYDSGVQFGAGRLHDRTVLLSAYDRNDY